MAARKRAGQLSSAIESVERVLNQRIRSQKKELSHWQLQREEAETREEACLRQIAEMEMALAVLKRTMGVDTAPPDTEHLDAIRYRSQTVAESCYDIMRASGGRVMVKDITKILTQAGKLRGRNAYSTVVKTMDRDERFERVGRGTYGLVAGFQPTLSS